ncbi:MAG: AraC family transcriptional regulator [Saprospiraceae bacterium]|nr:AraC family transcriptional regulator [Saprospiraceae bacterium]
MLDNFELEMKIVTESFAVPADLQPYIGSFWYMLADGPSHETSPIQYCLANAMVEMIVHLTPPFHHHGYIGGKYAQFPEAFVGGVHVGPVLFQMQGGTGIFGVSIKPETFVTLFERPIGEMADSFAEARSILGDTLGDLIKRVQDAPSNENRVQIAIEFFRQSVALRIRHDRFYFTEAMQYIRSSTGQHSVDEVCEKVFVSKRQLQRIFQENIGISPKTYVRIVRFRSAYDFVQRHPKTTWTEISHNFGYSDQSHFIRDFKEFTGKNPTSFLTGFAPQMSTPLATKA